jgi:hypothetical protein
MIYERHSTYEKSLSIIRQEEIMLTHFFRFMIIVLFVPVLLFSQERPLWKAHDLNRPKPKIITPPAQYLPVKPPSDAIVLYDGKDLSNWEAMDGDNTEWINGEGYFECVRGSGYIRSKQAFGDIQLHVEWAAPVPVEGESQGRGNSGVFLMGLYEVQVLDSYDNLTYADGQASAIYGQYPPQVNAARPPGEWQAYDIVFHRPHFNNLGMLVKPARMTVFHNGILVQDNVELWGGTEWQKYKSYKLHAEKLPISLQDHGNPVRFRNIWVRELSAVPEKAPDYLPILVLDETILEKYIGVYENEDGDEIRIDLEGSKLFLLRSAMRKAEMIPHTKKKFSLRFTAIDLDFKLDDKGVPIEMSLTFTGETYRFKRAD